MSKYTKELLEEHTKKSNTFTELLKSINLSEKVHGGMIGHIKKKMVLYGIDFSHFKGKGWAQGRINNNKAITVNDLQKFYLSSTPLKYTNSHNIKNWLYKFELKYEECEECKIKEWNNRKLSFHLDHVNGINTDYRLENLRILCPNCHSQTATYAGGNNKRK